MPIEDTCDNGRCRLYLFQCIHRAGGRTDLVADLTRDRRAAIGPTCRCMYICTNVESGRRDRKLRMIIGTGPGGRE